MHKRSDLELGALWLKSGRKGDYMTGTINGVKVVCFFNDRATEENKQPTWRVQRALSREMRQEQEDYA